MVKEREREEREREFWRKKVCESKKKSAKHRKKIYLPLFSPTNKIQHQRRPDPLNKVQRRPDVEQHPFDEAPARAQRRPLRGSGLFVVVFEEVMSKKKRPSFPLPPSLLSPLFPKRQQLLRKTHLDAPDIGSLGVGKPRVRLLLAPFRSRRSRLLWRRRSLSGGGIAAVDARHRSSPHAQLLRCGSDLAGLRIEH